MSDKIDELPRDVRGLCGGLVQDADGSYRELLSPVDAYASLWEVCKEMERDIADPETAVEDLPSIKEDLEARKKELGSLKQRILNSLTTRPLVSTPKNKRRLSLTVDGGAKSKVIKGLEDVEAGRYDRSQSKTKKAIFQSWGFLAENKRMPTHHELKGLGFNDQQATDAGKWFKIMADPKPDDESLFRPLQWVKKGPKQSEPNKK